MNIHLKLIDQLKDTVLPFLLVVEFNGKIISAGKGFGNLIGKEIDHHHIDDFIGFESPPSFKDCTTNTTKNLSIKIRLKSNKIELKGNAHVFENESIILFVFIPVFDDLNNLTSSGLNFSDIPEHSLLSDYIFLVQNHQTESKKKLDELNEKIERNEELQQKVKELETLARFPAENPNPVVRITDQGIVDFANESSKKHLLSVLGLRVGESVPETFNLLLNQAYSSPSGIFDKTIEIKDKIYSITILKIPNRDYFNLYAIEITNTKQEVRLEKQVLQNLQNEIKEVKDGLEKKITSQSNEIALNKTTREENLIHGSIVQEIFLKKNHHFDGINLFFQPKNIVSGDFFLTEKIKESEIVYLAVGDCIGKELTGSFLSIYFMDQIRSIIHKYPTDASLITIFNQVEKNSVNNKFFKKVNRFTSTDFTLVRLNTSSKKIEFASNNHNFISFNWHKRSIYQPTNDKQFFSVKSKTNSRNITSGTFSGLNQHLILFSDGIINQFGGDKHKKLKRRTLYQWIENGQILTENSCHIKEVFNTFKKNEEQIDDCTWMSYKL